MIRATSSSVNSTNCGLLSSFHLDLVSQSGSNAISCTVGLKTHAQDYQSTIKQTVKRVCGMWLSVFLECFVFVSADLSSSCLDIWNNNTPERIILFLDQIGLKSKRPSISKFVAPLISIKIKYCSKGGWQVSTNNRSRRLRFGSE